MNGSATVAPATSDTNKPLAPMRFTAGSLSRVEGPHYDVTTTPTASAQSLPLMEIPTGGWERTIYLLVTCTTAGNSAAVAFADGPWSVFEEITFRDARGNTIVGPLNGYDLYLANKWLGYSFGTDLANQVDYTATTGTGATGGSFSFVLPIPLEIIGRDAIGALANGASNTALRVQLTLAASSGIYSTPPTTLAGVRVRAFHEAWQQPLASAPNGAPYAQKPTGAGTFHQLTKTRYTTAVGENRIQLVRKGNPIRGLVMVWRNASNVRQSTSTILGTTPLQFLYEGSDLLSFDQQLLRFRMWERNANAVAGFDTGVLVFDWASDLDGKTGAELREQWLPTQPGSRVELRFTASAAGNLDVITDEVVPAGDIVFVP